MTSWLAKLRISAALDSGRPLPEKLRQRISADAELQRFVRRADTLGRALSIQPTAPRSSEPPLHDSIMRAVRTCAREKPPRRAPASLLLTEFLVVAAVAAMAGVCIWLAVHRAASTSGPSLAGPGMVLEMSGQMPNVMSSALMAPLTNELALVDRNLQDTTQILLASFP